MSTIKVNSVSNDDGINKFNIEGQMFKDETSLKKKLSWLFFSIFNQGAIRCKDKYNKTVGWISRDEFDKWKRTCTLIEDANKLDPKAFLKSYRNYSPKKASLDSKVVTYNEQFEKAAKGDSNAMLFVGDCFNGGVGVLYDHEMALIYYNNAAKAGNNRAAEKYVELAAQIKEWHYSNPVVKDQPDKGTELLIKAAHSGEGGAQLLLARLYKNGDGGVDRNFKQAENYFLQAIANKVPGARRELAAMLYEKEIRSNGYHGDDRAVKLLEQAGKEGDSEAWFLLGNYYSSPGIGGFSYPRRPNEEMAKECWKKASQMGFEEASKKLEMNK